MKKLIEQTLCYIHMILKNDFSIELEVAQW